MNTSKRYSPEVRERAVRMVLEHEEEYWASPGSPPPYGSDASTPSRPRLGKVGIAVWDIFWVHRILGPSTIPGGFSGNVPWCTDEESI
jgi:hypothetical protein